MENVPNKSDLAARISKLFAEIEEALKYIRHTGNSIEVTEAYKKIRELGLWITLAMSVENPSVQETPVREKVKFAKRK